MLLTNGTKNNGTDKKKFKKVSTDRQYEVMIWKKIIGEPVLTDDVKKIMVLTCCYWQLLKRVCDTVNVGS